VSVQEKIARLERFIRENPGLSQVPFLVVAGRPVTPVEALNMLRMGQYVSEILTGLSRLGLDPAQEELWILTEEFYRRLAAARPELRIYAIGAYVPVMSPAEALEHVRSRDEVGRQLVGMYARLLSFIRARVDW